MRWIFPPAGLCITASPATALLQPRLNARPEEHSGANRPCCFEGPRHWIEPHAKVLEFLKDHPDVRLAILFGSLASDRGTAESDLDLAIDAGRRLDLSLKMNLISELANRIGRPVDLVDLRIAGEPLLGQILRYGKKILGDNRHYADLIRKHVFDEADFLRYRTGMIAERRRAWIRI